MKTIHEIKSFIESLPESTQRAMNVMIAHVSAGASLYVVSIDHTEADTHIYPRAMGKRVITTHRQVMDWSHLSVVPIEETVNWALDCKNNACGYETGYVHHTTIPTSQFMAVFGDMAINIKNGSINAVDGGIRFNTYIMKQVVHCLKAERLPNNARQAAAMGLPVGLFA